MCKCSGYIANTEGRGHSFGDNAIEDTLKNPFFNTKNFNLQARFMQIQHLTMKADVFLAYKTPFFEQYQFQK